MDVQALKLYTQIPPQVEDDVETAHRIMYSAESAVQGLKRLHSHLARDGKVGRVVANTIQTLTTGMEGMDEHFHQYPVKSYTRDPSGINYSVTVENLVVGIAKALGRALKAIFDYIAKLIKAVFSKRPHNERQVSKLKADLKRSVEAAKRHPRTTALTPKQLAVAGGFSPVSCWLVGRQAGLIKDVTPQAFLAMLQLSESQMLEYVRHQLADIRAVLADKTPVPVKAQAIKEITERTLPTPIAPYLSSSIRLDGTETNGQHYHQRLKQMMHEVSHLNQATPDKITTPEDIHQVVASLEGSQLLDPRFGFSDTRLYASCEKDLSSIRDSVKRISEGREGTTGAEVDEQLLHCAKHLQGLTNAIVGMESLINHYRVAVLDVTKLLHFVNSGL